MQEIFPEQAQTEPQFFLEKLKQPGTYPAPAGGFPELEGYSVVTVRMREATITASNDPVINAAPPPPPPQPTYAYSQPNNASAYTYAAAATPQLVTAKPRKRLFGRDLAIWICVAQLGVIIYWLVGPAMEQKRVEIKGVQASAIPGSFTGFFTSAADWPAQFWNGAKARVIGVKPEPKKAGKASRKATPGHKGFIPPPPPEMARGGMMVPPPPVAYALPLAGAAAASTLPSPPPRKVADPGRGETRLGESRSVPLPEPESPAPNAVPADHALTASIVPTEEAPSSEPAASALPDWLQKVPTYNWEEATNTGNPVVAPSSPQPARTVMAGNRKRTITDR
jgi:hypothetical protein